MAAWCPARRRPVPGAPLRLKTHRTHARTAAHAHPRTHTRKRNTHTHTLTHTHTHTHPAPQAKAGDPDDDDEEMADGAAPHHARRSHVDVAGRDRRERGGGKRRGGKARGGAGEGGGKGRAWVLKKKDKQRQQGGVVRPDTKYTARKRRHIV
jgi:hypothetical protein